MGQSIKKPEDTCEGCYQIFAVKDKYHKRIINAVVILAQKLVQGIGINPLKFTKHGMDFVNVNIGFQ
jgi:hypothetical protein